MSDDRDKKVSGTRYEDWAGVKAKYEREDQEGISSIYKKIRILQNKISDLEKKIEQSR